MGSISDNFYNVYVLFAVFAAVGGFAILAWVMYGVWQWLKRRGEE